MVRILWLLVSRLRISALHEVPALALDICSDRFVVLKEHLAPLRDGTCYL